MNLSEQLDLIEDQLAWLTAKIYSEQCRETKAELLGRVKQLGRELERLVPEIKEAK